MSKKIFIICTVRGATPEYRFKLENYVQELEDKGHTVHLPHRDTNQESSGLEICTQNKQAIQLSDEVHIFYNPKSQGSHFDMGVAFGLNKTMVVVENTKYGPGKSFPRMLDEWADMNNLKTFPICFILESDDWTGVYVNKELIYEGHELPAGVAPFMDMYGFRYSDVKVSYIGDEDDADAVTSGCFPKHFDELKNTTQYIKEF